MVPRRASRRWQRRGHGSMRDRHSHLRPHNVDLRHAGPPASTRAQESTPAAETTGVEVAPGVTFELMPASEDPPSLYRLRFAPGATLSFVDDPAISLVYVESGALSLQLDAAVSDARPEASSGDEEEADTAVEPDRRRLLRPAAAGGGGDPQRGSGTDVDRDRRHHPRHDPGGRDGYADRLTPSPPAPLSQCAGRGGTPSRV